ncbi:hypothetical protein [uncultured Tateyamaria sp.]|uniref:hypothetical protein n=1 Tax=uncultured Tateyamaria sp. TaxID=455651 RepID=UPI002617BC90|nr:hypothetical protein [uncultured Tateyamaria sp.]
MSYHSYQPGLFDPAQGALPIGAPDTAPATEKQIAFARSLAAKTGVKLPAHLLRDKAGLSAWIDQTKAAVPASRFSNYPSAKQVQFAERIARLKRRDIPAECFKDKVMMSRWIDGNKPR